MFTIKIQLISYYIIPKNTIFSFNGHIQNLLQKFGKTIEEKNVRFPITSNPGNYQSLI